MNRNLLSLAALLGALSVALGAFAAHKLKEIFPPDALGLFETGVRYQFYHVFALFAVAILSERSRSRWMRWSGVCFVAGIILFCGSLYALAALKAADQMDFAVVGIITPLGGLLLIAGWIFLLLGVSKKT
jgi:uncharacterized membrane protein YgdD (TMEM256/DUF423 family)